MEGVKEEGFVVAAILVNEQLREMEQEEEEILE